MEMMEEVETDEQRVQKVARKVTRPRGIGEPSLEFGPDHSGDRSAYVRFPVTMAVRLTSARIQQLVKFSRTVRDSLYTLGTGMLFYVSYEDETE